MQPQTFEGFLTELEGLTAEQRQVVTNRLKVLTERDDSARLIAERLGQRAACVHCGHPHLQRFGYTGSRQPRYRCKACRKTFTGLTGTPFARLRDKDKLLAHATCLSAGMTIRATARTVGLTVDRAFRWRHRSLTFLARQQPHGFTGIVEADETFFRRSFKGQRRGLARAPKKRGGPAKDVTESERVGVLVAMQRGLRVTSNRRLDDLSADTLTEALRPVVSGDALLSTDGNPSYRLAAAALGIDAGSFVVSHHGPGGCGTWHVQNVNAYDSRLKRWMGRFYGVATKYLDHYLGWHRLLDRFEHAVTGQQFLFHALRPHFVNT